MKPNEAEALKQLDKYVESIILEATICTEMENFGGQKGRCPLQKWIKRIKIWRRGSMKFYRVEDEVVITDKELGVGTELVANITDGAGEKHVPVVSVDSDKVVVKVGEVEHPSLPAHYIELIVLETNTGIHTKWLKPGMKPEASVRLVEGEEVVAAYEHCNLHGLWMTNV